MRGESASLVTGFATRYRPDVPRELRDVPSRFRRRPRLFGLRATRLRFGVHEDARPRLLQNYLLCDKKKEL